MKCPKCGYVSFDHLSECKNCHTNMTAVREGLGFALLKPATPSLLGSLLRDPPPQPPQLCAQAQTQIYNPFGFEEQSSGALDAEFQYQLAPAALETFSDSEAEDDFSLLDISDEELDLLMDKDPLERVEQEENHSPGAHEHPRPKSPEIAISVETEELDLSLEDLFDEQDQTPPDPHSNPASPQNPPPPQSEHSAGMPDDAEEDFVIDLSENDLDDLLKRLDGVTGSKS